MLHNTTRTRLSEKKNTRCILPKMSVLKHECYYISFPCQIPTQIVKTWSNHPPESGNGFENNDGIFARFPFAELEMRFAFFQQSSGIHISHYAILNTEAQKYLLALKFKSMESGVKMQILIKYFKQD